jgi:hypothetical protein
MTEAGKEMTLEIPSVLQNRVWAKGRSFEIARTTLFFCEEARSLNFLTEVAQTGVSRLGNMLRRSSSLQAHLTNMFQGRT